MSITSTLRKAAHLQEKIEGLRGKLVALLAQARSEVENAPIPELARALGGRKPGRPASRGSAKVRGGGVNGYHGGNGGTRTLGTMSRRDGRGGGNNGAAGRYGSGRGGLAGLKRRVSPLKGKKRSASPSGPLAPAVVKVLHGADGKPMCVREILDGLLLAGYEFTTNEPKKNLAARIYRLKGVKQVGEGLFAAL